MKSTILAVALLSLTATAFSAEKPADKPPAKTVDRAPAVVGPPIPVTAAPVPATPAPPVKKGEGLKK